MINLATRTRSVACDSAPAEELRLAGAPQWLTDAPYGEPRTRVVGRVGPFELRRAWVYWVATAVKPSAPGAPAPGLPLEAAIRLHESPYAGRRPKYGAKYAGHEAVLGAVVRAVGHAGGIHPGEKPNYTAVRFTGGGVAVRVLSTQDAAYFAAFPEFKPRPGEEWRHAGDDLTDTAQFVCGYHIDTQEGLNAFVRFVQAHVAASKEPQP